MEIMSSNKLLEDAVEAIPFIFSIAKTALYRCSIILSNWDVLCFRLFLRHRRFRV
eukprot:Gb_06542 [translate_table: standard]